jgi:hypothetical protein
MDGSAKGTNPPKVPFCAGISTLRAVFPRRWLALERFKDFLTPPNSVTLFIIPFWRQSIAERPHLN